MKSKKNINGTHKSLHQKCFGFKKEIMQINLKKLYDIYVCKVAFALQSLNLKKYILRIPYIV